MLSSSFEVNIRELSCQLPQILRGIKQGREQTWIKMTSSKLCTAHSREAARALAQLGVGSCFLSRRLGIEPAVLRYHSPRSLWCGIRLSLAWQPPFSPTFWWSFSPSAQVLDPLSPGLPQMGSSSLPHMSLWPCLLDGVPGIHRREMLRWGNCGTTGCSLHREETPGATSSHQGYTSLL